MAAVMLGNGIVGISANFLRAVTLFSFPASKNGISNKENSFNGAMVFFAICAAFCIFNGILMKCLMNNKCGIYWMNRVEAPKDLGSDVGTMASAETLDREDKPLKDSKI